MKIKIFTKKKKKREKNTIKKTERKREKKNLKKGIKLIESNGYEPVLGKHLYTKYSNGYNYAGTEKERISEINWAFNNEEIGAIWASRGGYGCQHLLRHV